MYLFVWNREGTKRAVGEYRAALWESLKTAPRPVKVTAELCQLVAQHLAKIEIVTSLVPLSQYITKERGSYCNISSYATRRRRKKTGEVEIMATLSSVEDKKVEIGVKHSFYLDPKRNSLSLNEAYEKYPLIVAQNMAVFPGLWSFALICEPDELSVVLPKFNEYVSLVMRYEELVAGPVQKYRGALEHDTFMSWEWPYRKNKALVFGYVPFDSVKRLKFGNGWGKVDCIWLYDLPPVDVVVASVEGDVPFYPTRQPDTVPAFVPMREIDTIFAGDEVKIVANGVSLLLGPNLSQLGFDEYDNEAVRQVAEVTYNTWQSCVFGESAGLERVPESNC